MAMGVCLVAYQIIYESEKRQKMMGNPIRRILLTLVFFSVFLWSVSAFWPEGKSLLKMILIPGDPDRTLQAAEVFAQELGSGFSFKDAVVNFYTAVRSYGCSG